MDGAEELGHFIDERLVDTFPEHLADDLPKRLERAFKSMWTGAQSSQQLRCVAVTDGEIMREIQKPPPKPASKGAWFVLPSQLNGAEYPGPRAVVREVGAYMSDRTGGPRGQLACHPAAAQFIIDNAARDGYEGGISAVDFLQGPGAPEGFRLVNGYLQLPTGMTDQQFRGFLKCLAELRPLMMADVPANGLDPSMSGFSRTKHRVGLVYASAVPLETYVNVPRELADKELHRKLAQAVLLTQYYGAMRQIARWAREGGSGPVVVNLMPLGGGVFNNSWSSIVGAISAAVELLQEDGLLHLLDVRLLTYEGTPAEGSIFAKELDNRGKLRPR